jgi:hypothetical protein
MEEFLGQTTNHRFVVIGGGKGVLMGIAFLFEWVVVVALGGVLRLLLVSCEAKL